MVKFGGAEFNAEENSYSPTKELLRQSATAGMGGWKDPSGGSTQIDTYEESLNRRPNQKLGKTTLSLYGREPIASAPVQPFVPDPTVNQIMQGQPRPKQDQGPLSDLGDWANFFTQTIAPIFTPGGIPLKQMERRVQMSQTWDAALESDDPMIRGLATQWSNKALSNEVDAFTAMSSFYEQYERINAVRAGKSNVLQDQLTYKTPEELARGGDLGQKAGAAFSQAMIPLFALQQAAVRSQSEGGVYRAFGVIPTPVVMEDRIADIGRDYDMPEHGRLTEGLIEATTQYREGNLTEDEYRDTILVEGFGLTNPEQLGEGNWWINAPTSLALEIISDPLTLASVGTGTLAKAGGMGAKVVVPNVLRSIGDDALEVAAKAAGKTAKEFAEGATANAAEAIKNTAIKEARALLDETAAQMKNTAVDALEPLDIVEALPTFAAKHPQYAKSVERLTSIQAGGRSAALGSFATKAPSIIRTGYMIDRALDPLTLVGKGVGAARARLAISHLYAEGFYDALGWVHVNGVRDVLRSVGITDDQSNTLIGRAASNHAIQVGNNTVMQRMKAQGSKWVPDASTPTEQARAAVERKGGDVRGAMMRQVDETSEYIVPSSRGGASAGLAGWREWARTALMELGAKGDIDGVVAKMTERQIMVLRHMFWGHMIEVVDRARNAAMPTPKFGADLIDRVTMVGPRQLTANNLRELKAALRAKDYTKIRHAITLYDDLRINVSELLPDDEMATVVAKLLDALEGKVPNVIEKSADNPKAFNDFIDEYGDRGYRLALRPADEDLARVIYDADGNALGVHSWVDAVVDATPAQRVGRLRAVMTDLTRGISASSVERNAGRRFIQQMAEATGATEAESKAIYDSVRKIARASDTTPRGLSIKQMEEAVVEAKGVRREITNEGRRAIVDAVMYAYQNEIRLVGATQSLTGRAKVIAGTWNNWAGYMAENLYPKLRFSWSPIFNAQEIVELPYFMMLRGQFPMRSAIGSLTGGKVFGEHALNKSIYDEKTRFLMDYFRESNFVASDMIEGSDLVRRGFKVSERIASRRTPIGRWGERQIAHFANFFNLTERKANGESVIYRNRMGDMFQKSLMEESPGTWYAARAMYPKEMSDGEFVTSWLYDLLGRTDPDSVWVKTSPEMFKPQHVGKRSKFSAPLIGYIIGGEDGVHLTTDALRARIRNKSDALDFNYVENALRQAGADNEYIERARWLLDGPTVDEFYKSVRKGGVSLKQVRAMRRVDERNAELMGISHNEYLGRHWASAAQSIDEFGDQKGIYAFQLIVDSLETRGLKAPERGSPMLADLTASGQKMVVDWVSYARTAVRQPGKDADKTLPRVGDLPKDVQAARAKVIGWEGSREQRALNPRLGNPPTKSADSQEPLLRGSRHTLGKVSYADWVKQLEAIFPDEAARREYADWYTDMQRGFLALFSETPESQVQKAAEMIVAFGVTQLNTSPADGMEYLFRVLSMAQRGEDWPSVLGLTPAQAKQVKQASGGLNFGQLQSILMDKGTVLPEGLGQKLADFVDSLIGSPTRSVGIDGPNPLRPWGPVAGDVWAKRDLGFVDPKVGKEMWRVIDGARIETYVDKNGVTKQRGFSKTIGDIKKDPSGKPILDSEGDVIYNSVDRIEVEMEDGSIYIIRGDQIGDSVPTNLEYDYIVEYYNGLADYLNETNYLNRRWTAADAQAVGWFRAKVAFGDATGDVRSALYKGRWTAGTEINPVQRQTIAPPPKGIGSPQGDTLYTSEQYISQYRAQIKSDVSMYAQGDVVDQVAMRGEPNSVVGVTIDAQRDWLGAPTIRIPGYEPEVGPEGFVSVYSYYDDNGDIAGNVVIALNEEGIADAVLQVRVRDDAQRKGVASAMYDQAQADGLDIKGVTGENGVTSMGEKYTVSYKDRPFPYAHIFPPASAIGEESTYLLHDQMSLYIHRQALEDTGVLTPRRLQGSADGYRIDRDGNVVHDRIVEVLADRSAAEQYAARLGFYSQQDEVLLIRDTKINAFDYDNAKGKGNIGGVVRVIVSGPEEGRKLIEAIAANPSSKFPPRAHLSQADDGTWMVQALSDIPDKRLFNKAIKGIDAEINAALEREAVVESGSVEFIRVTNDWEANPDGAGYLNIVKSPSHVVDKHGRRPTTPAPTAGQLERRRQRRLAARAEDLVQQIVPREAADVRTSRLYAAPLPDRAGGRVRTADDLRASGVDGIEYQRAPSGTRGAITRASDGRTALYLGGRRVSPDTLLHELGHKFAWELDPSAVRRIKGIRDGLEGKRPGTARGRNATRLTSNEHEWFVSQYLLWIKDPASVHTTLRPLMEAFREEIVNVGPITKEALKPLVARVEAGKKAVDAAVASHGGRSPEARAARAALRDARQAVKDAKATGEGLSPEMKAFFDEQAAAAGRSEPAAYWDMDEDLMFQHVQRGHERAARQAADLTHFKANRSVMERSINHPFFGAYPFSYMYGKVLPELVEFLMFRPFGFKAPGVGLTVTNRMYQSFMNQQEHDEELRNYLFQNEPALRALSMFVPGVPWELPVNAPLWLRRVTEAMITNEQRVAEGKEPLEVDYAKLVTDSLGYSFGMGRAPQQFSEAAQGFAQLPGIAVSAMTGEPPPPEEEGTFGQPDSGPFKQNPVTPTPNETPTEMDQPDAPQGYNVEDFNMGGTPIPASDMTNSINEQIILLEQSLSQIKTE